MAEFKVGDLVLDLDDGDIGRIIAVVKTREQTLEIEILHTTRTVGLRPGDHFHDKPDNQQKIDNTELAELVSIFG